jgi:hypothetical protein
MRFLFRGVVDVHLRLGLGLACDDAVAQLAHGNLGGLHGNCLQLDHGHAVAHRTQAAMVASITTASTAFLVAAVCILPTATSVATADASYNTLTMAAWASSPSRLIRPYCITILYHNLLLFIDIFHI